MKYDNRFLSIDFETGGLPDALKKQAVFEVAVTEIGIAVIDIEKLEIIDKYSCLFKPYADDLIYQPKALEVSNISIDLLEKKGLEMKVAFEQISNFVSKHFIGKKKPKIVGHNIIGFDMDFVQNLWELNKASIDKYFDIVDIWDTMLMARLKYVDGSMSLPSVIERLSLENKQAHRALQDAMITAEVFINFVKSLRGDGIASKKEKRFRENFQF